jgi:predicted AAA+ superfamily ATPase
MAVDKAKQPGMFWLTGSQKFHLMRGITESLAGRIAIIDMLGFSRAEIEERAEQSSPFLPTAAWVAAAKARQPAVSKLRDIYRDIWQGSYPKLITDPHISREIFYSSYIQTYISRDVKDFTKIGNERAFTLFLRATAARTGQLVNYHELARDVEMDSKTTKSWLSILEASGIIYLLAPYHTNVTKRLIKTPKLYFLDTGLCAYLTQWSTPEALEAGAMSGAILETYVLSEILKSYWHNGRNPYLYFYRDRDMREVDLLIEQDQTLYPVEIKKTATPSNTASKNFSVLTKLDKKIGHGVVICLVPEAVALSRTVDAVPLGYL